MLHTLSGIILMLIMFLVLYTLNKSTSINFYVNIWFLLFLSFSVTMMFGVLWEVFEFAMDQTFNTQMQPSLQDTMMDIMVEIIGAFLVAVIAILYITRKKVYTFDDTIKNFVEQNRDEISEMVDKHPEGKNDQTARRISSPARKNL